MGIPGKSTNGFRPFMKALQQEKLCQPVRMPKWEIPSERPSIKAEAEGELWLEDFVFIFKELRLKNE